MKNVGHKTQTRDRVVPFLIISLLLHALLLVGFSVHQSLMANRTPTQAPKKPDSKTTVQFVDMAEAKRMVETLEESKNKPKDAKFLSAHDNAVKKETRAVTHGDYQNVRSKEAPQANQQNQKQSNKQAVEQTATESSQKTEMRTFKHGDFAVPTKKKVQKATTISDLRPNTMGAMSESQYAVSQSPDMIKDVAAGAETHLNTKEFVYYSYFSRIKKDLRQRWEPLIHQKVQSVIRKGMQRELASTESKLTGVVLSMDERGVIQKIQIRTTSGLSDLDDAAIEALKAIGQFPNPPKDLIVDGMVTIAWNFVLES